MVNCFVLNVKKIPKKTHSRKCICFCLSEPSIADFIGRSAIKLRNRKAFLLCGFLVYSSSTARSLTGSFSSSLWVTFRRLKSAFMLNTARAATPIKKIVSGMALKVSSI